MSSLNTSNPITDSAAPEKVTIWQWGFRLLRWSTYLAAVVTLILLLHKSPPPSVAASPQAAARAEEKFGQVHQSLSDGQQATLRLDEAELNSFLLTHLELASSSSLSPSDGQSAKTAGDVEQMQSSVRDVKVQMIDDRVKAYVVFDVHGKDLSLELEGRLGATNGYLKFEPLSGQIGSLPIPQSTLESAVKRLMDSPENRDRLRLPPDLADLRIENGEFVATYR
jgi:hypothetical protein